MNSTILTKHTTIIDIIIKLNTNFKTVSEAYFKAATGLFQQPIYHAIKILELLYLYEPNVLDKILAYAIARDKLDIKSIKQLIRNNFFEIIANKEKIGIVPKITDIEGIIRSCDYYEVSQEVTSL